VRIPDDVLQVLTDDRTVIEGKQVRIPFQLDPGLYERVNKILKDIGGRWDGRKAVRAHVFPYPVEDFMRQALLAGEFPSRSDQGWYPTPPPVVHAMLEHASIRPGMTVLEPSAGAGAIAGPAAGRGGLVDCVEIDQRRAHVLREHCKPRRVIEGDFLALDPLEWETGYQRVLMNPPFHAALRHVMHAIGFMAADSVLVSVLPEGVMWHTDRATEEFRQLVRDAEGQLIRLPADAFKESGTHMRTVLLVLCSDPDGPLPNHPWRQAQPRQLDLFAV